VLRAIEGRQDDICYFETLDGQRRPFFPDTIRRMVLLASAEIGDYQAVQERCGHLRLHLVTPPGADFAPVARAVRAQVAATLAGYGCRSATVEVEPGLAPPPPGAKRRRVQRKG
jgi:phenylacetate-coenzyme A ligase PaaK-like adenylate-forming protein